MLHSLIELSEKSNKQNCPLHFGENWPPLTQSNSIVFCLFLPTWNLRRHPIMTYFFAKNKNSYLQQYEPKNYKRLPLKLIVSNKNRSLKLLHLWCEKQCQQELASLVFSLQSFKRFYLIFWKVEPKGKKNASHSITLNKMGYKLYSGKERKHLLRRKN